MSYHSLRWYKNAEMSDIYKIVGKNLRFSEKIMKNYRMFEKFGKKLSYILKNRKQIKPTGFFKNPVCT